MKINPKHTKSHKKHTKRGDRARHGPWHDMATIQPTILKMITRKKRSIYLKETNPKIKRKQEGEKRIPENCTFA